MLSYFYGYFPYLVCKSKDKDGNEIEAVDEVVWYIIFGILMFINILILILFFIYTCGVVIKDLVSLQLEINIHK